MTIVRKVTSTKDAKGILRLIPYTGGREKTGRRPIVELRVKSLA